LKRNAADGLFTSPSSFGYSYFRTDVKIEYHEGR
jgi:hypothetical protein